MRPSTARSYASDIVSEAGAVDGGAEASHEYSSLTLLKRMGSINRDEQFLYILGSLAAICSGAVYPAFGIVFCACMMRC